MVPTKRTFGLEGDKVSDDPQWTPRRRLTTEGRVFGNVMRGMTSNEIELRLEPLLRTMVREEVDFAVEHISHSSTRSGSRACQLQFQNKFPSTLFTNTKVESVDSKPIKVVLVDPGSKRMITSGALSSMKIEIVVLNGDFVAGEVEDWTKKDFNGCIVPEREGKRPLVTGNITINLKDGVAELDNICFTDNSSWIRCRKFRLGARAQSSSAIVREAKSEAFVVKDHRGESYKKHYPPSLADEVWRLDKIAKDGALHVRLAELAGISTVKEFLRLYVTDPSALREVLGGESGISNTIWDKIIKHATTCILDDKMYMYTTTAEMVTLVFNSICEVIGAIFNGQVYQDLETLSLSQARLVEEVKQQAYKNLYDLMPFNEQQIVGPTPLLSTLQDEHLCNSSAGPLNVSNPVGDQAQLQMNLDYDQMRAPRSYTFEVGSGSQHEVSKTYCPTITNSFRMKDCLHGFHNGGYDTAPVRSLEPVSMMGDLAAEDISEVRISSWPTNEFFNASSSQSAGIASSGIGFCLSRNRKPRARWFKLRAAMTWVISVRRDVAAKRMAARPLYMDF